MRTILLVILVLALIGSMPIYPYSAGLGWGWYPPLGLVVLIILVIVLVRGDL